MEGFEISAMHMLNLDKPAAEELLEIYKVRHKLSLNY